MKKDGQEEDCSGPDWLQKNPNKKNLFGIPKVEEQYWRSNMETDRFSQQNFFLSNRKVICTQRALKRPK